MKGLPRIRINPEIMKNETEEESKNKKKKNESMMIMVFAVGIIIFIGFLFSKGRTTRAQLNEIKTLPYHSVQIENVKDGVYHGEISTSFIYIVLDAEVKNGSLKNINFTKTNGKGINNLEEIASRMIEENKTQIELKKRQEINTLVLMSCIDSAFWNADQDLQEIK